MSALLPSDGDEKLENGPHGNYDVILMPASEVRYDAGAGGDASRYEQPWQDDPLNDKNEVRNGCVILKVAKGSVICQFFVLSMN